MSLHVCRNHSIIRLIILSVSCPLDDFMFSVSEGDFQESVKVAFLQKWATANDVLMRRGRASPEARQQSELTKLGLRNDTAAHSKHKYAYISCAK